ncbi:MAG: UTP--glucose-1-phosphate uridylyltransferase [Alphaproteobacteria bacterium MarineAlpha3_Bin4]|nr:MAG: UTP--glucose-1-phosphate uridylyltransferase [Alphaproteobacteria bacterium MarineAlpha3_Bin4]
MVKPVTKAVFPVAGLGTRFLPATKVVPKELLPVVDKPLIQYAVDEALAAGIKDLILVTAEGENLISRYLEHADALEVVLRERGKELELRSITDGLPPPGSLTCVVQSEPLGLGHAVWCAKELIDEQPFAVILPDDLVQADPGCLAQMVAAYGKTGGNVVAVEDVPREQTARYGVLDVEMEYGRLARARGLVEKPDPVEAPSTLSIIGRYILQPEVLGYLDRQECGAGNEIQLTDAMAKTIGKIPFHGLRFQGRRFDCGNKLGFIVANVAFAAAREDLGGDICEVLAPFI